MAIEQPSAVRSNCNTTRYNDCLNGNKAATCGLSMVALLALKRAVRCCCIAFGASLLLLCYCNRKWPSNVTLLSSHQACDCCSIAILHCIRFVVYCNVNEQPIAVLVQLERAVYCCAVAIGAAVCCCSIACETSGRLWFY